MTSPLSRRAVIKRAAAVGAATAVPVPVIMAQDSADAPYTNLSPAAAATLEAIVARLIPSDENGPGALEAGASRYIDRALGTALAAYAPIYRAGLDGVDAHARATVGGVFADLDPDGQDAVLADVEQNRAAGFAADAAGFFDLVLAHTLEGTFGDPGYGGNRDFVGWELIAYPGIRLAVGAPEQRMDADLTPTRLSAYDLPMFAADARSNEDGA